MGVLSFYWAVVERAFWEGVELSHMIVFLAVAAAGLLHSWLRQRAEHKIGSGRVAIVFLVALIAARVPFAIHSMWQEEHAARALAECRLDRIQSARDQRRAFVLQNLLPYYNKAQELLHRRITETDFPSWAAETGTFQKAVADWVRTNMGDFAAAKLVNMDGPSYDFQMIRINSAHMTVLNWLNKASANLTALMQQSEFDQFTPDPPRDCH